MTTVISFPVKLQYCIKNTFGTMSSGKYQQEIVGGVGSTQSFIEPDRGSKRKQNDRLPDQNASNFAHP